MKHKSLVRWACLALACALAAGCAGHTPPVASSQPSQDAAHKEYQNYLTQTTLRYPASWAYQETDGDQDSQLSAYFDIEGGSAAIQFFFLTDEQKQANVFLQQLDLDDIAQEQAKAGPYEGLLVSGTDGLDKISVFEGYRGWYDTGVQCLMRVYLNSTELDGDDLYEVMLDMLDSASVAEQQAPAIQQWAEQDFTAEYGIKLSIPSDWYVNPEYYPEDPSLILDFEVAQGGNVVTVEYGTTDKQGYQALLDYTKTFITSSGAVGGAYEEKGNTVTASGLYEGRRTVTKIQKKSSKGGKIRYLQVSYQLRPDLETTYRDAIVQMEQSIVLQ